MNILVEITSQEEDGPQGWSIKFQARDIRTDEQMRVTKAHAKCALSDLLE